MSEYDVAIVGGGFAGLTAAFELARTGAKVHVSEASSAPGGLAGTFEFDDGVVLEKFYHHWFNNDVHVPAIVRELGMEGDIITQPSSTGMYYNGRIWRLSSPLDLLRFKPLSLFSRIRLGLMVLQVRRITDWREIEHLSVRQWLEPICGKEAYRVVWEPLLKSKFAKYADRVNAVWMWKKLVLRGSSRDAQGREELSYFKGGFGRLALALADAVKQNGGSITFDSEVTSVDFEGDKVTALNTTTGKIIADQYLFTTALPIIADVFAGAEVEEWTRKLRSVEYLGNVCLVLRLDRSLSQTYWLNVNDPGFPFVGVIEHTNFDPPEKYRGSHIVYLSKYLATDEAAWSMSDAEYLDFALSYVSKMFPDFQRSWILDHKVWRAEFAQQVTEANYSQYVPGNETPFSNAHVYSMAQIYPEDRGTNYAIRQGKEAAASIQKHLGAGQLLA